MDSNGMCHASQILDGAMKTPWKIPNDVLSKYCKTEHFENCPRFLAFLGVLRARSGLRR